MECGEQCVMTGGIIIITRITMLPELCAGNWDTMSTQVEVSYSLFTLAWNGYEPVHGIVLKNGSPPFTLATIIGVSITHAALSPADGCCCGYFTVIVSA